MEQWLGDEARAIAHSAQGLTIDHERTSDDDVTKYGREIGIPVTDALIRSPTRLVERVLTAFPQRQQKLAASA